MRSLSWLLLALLHAGCSSCGDAPQTAAAGQCPEGMVYVPGGTFRMGTEFVYYNDHERPVHEVTLSPYCIAQTEVTVAAYKACEDAGGCTAWHTRFYCTPDDEPDRMRRPRNCIDWAQADQYCRWLGGRLPTEAEWEFAAVGTDGRMYPWGNEPPDENRARFGGRRNVEAPSDVGTHPSGRSAFGLDDMAGNVSEWVQDLRCPYSTEPQRNPVRNDRDPACSIHRVSRGGSWDSTHAPGLRGACRMSGTPDDASYDQGVRCAAAPR